MCLSLASCHLDAKAFKALPGMSAEVDQAVAAPVGISALPLKLFICIRFDREKDTVQQKMTIVVSTRMCTIVQK